MDVQVGDIGGWYSGTDASASSDDILQATFANAKLLLRSITKPQDYERLFPPSIHPNARDVSHHTVFDVQRGLKEAQTSYECRIGQRADPFQMIAPTAANSLSTSITPLGKAKAKARLWLTGLSEKLLYYGNIFDIMVQHHPEYVSLAWGTFKLLFIAIASHAETASKLSKSISQIADLLPQHSLHLILYPTPQMQVAVARLYAHILNFFLSSLKWYKDSRAVHAFKSIFQPWDLKFRHEYEAIAAESLQIRHLADIALKAEVRDTRLEVVEGTRHWQAVRQELSELKTENRRLVGLVEDRFGMMEDSMLCMYKEIRLDLTSQRTTLNRVHLNQMLSLPLWNSLPTSGDSLHFCRSMRNRRRIRSKMPLPDVEKLETWTLQQTNAVLLIDYVPTVAKAFMVDLIDLILESHMPIIWALRYADFWDQQLTSIDIVRMLVLQAIQVSAKGLLENPFPVTVEQLREAASLRDWVIILSQVLSGMNHAFIALDADLLAHATAHERSEALDILDLLRMKLASKVKIVTAASSVSRAYAKELEQSNACIKIRTQDFGGWRRRHRPQKPMTRSRRR